MKWLRTLKERLAKLEKDMYANYPYHFNDSVLEQLRRLRTDVNALDDEIRMIKTFLDVDTCRINTVKLVKKGKPCP